MNKNIKTILLFTIGLGILAYMILKLNLNLSFIYSIKHFEYIIIPITLMPFSYLLTATRIRYLLLAVGEKRTSFKDLVIIEWISKFIYNVAPSKLNVPAKAVLLNKLCNVEIRKGISLTISEYALDTSMTIIIAVAGVYLLFQKLPYISIVKLQYFVMFLVLCVSVFFGMPSKAFDWLAAKIEELNAQLLKKMFIFALTTLKTIRTAWITIIFSKYIVNILLIMVIFIGLSVLVTEFLFLSVSYSVPLLWILLVNSCAIVVSGITNIPGGLGVREVSTVLLYASLGVPEEISVVVALIDRVLTVIPIIVGYFFSLSIGVNKIIGNRDFLLRNRLFASSKKLDPKKK